MLYVYLSRSFGYHIFIMNYTVSFVQFISQESHLRTRAEFHHILEYTCFTANSTGSPWRPNKKPGKRITINQWPLGFTENISSKFTIFLSIVGAIVFIFSYWKTIRITFKYAFLFKFCLNIIVLRVNLSATINKSKEKKICSPNFFSKFKKYGVL
jgi:hypothetical protein